MSRGLVSVSLSQTNTSNDADLYTAESYHRNATDLLVGLLRLLIATIEHRKYITCYLLIFGNVQPVCEKYMAVNTAQCD